MAAVRHVRASARRNPRPDATVVVAEACIRWLQNGRMSDQVSEWFAMADSAPARPLTIGELRDELQLQAALIVTTGTGGPPFKEVDPEYKARDRVLRSNFSRLGLAYPYPWASLWDWHGFYSMQLPTYQSRRDHIRELTSPCLLQLASIEETGVVHDPRPEAGDAPTWDGVNVRVRALIDEYASAQDRDTRQDVGRRSREILIDVGRLISEQITPPERDVPKGADARAWFDLLLASKASGSEKKELRAAMRAVWDLAQKVTHGDIDDVDAFSAAQATVLIVRATQKLLGTGAGT